MYTYYKEIKSEEHMLYATEIAELAGIYSLTDKPATALVSSVLYEHINSLKNYEQCYYLSGNYNRKNKVYPKNIYVDAIMNFFRKITLVYGEDIPDANEITMVVLNKKYKFKIIETNHNTNYR